MRQTTKNRIEAAKAFNEAARHFNKADKKAVLKATSRDNIAPKEKHVQCTPRAVTKAVCCQCTCRSSSWECVCAVILGVARNPGYPYADLMRRMAKRLRQKDAIVRYAACWHSVHSNIGNGSHRSC